VTSPPGGATSGTAAKRLNGVDNSANLGVGGRCAGGDTNDFRVVEPLTLELVGRLDVVRARVALAADLGEPRRVPGVVAPHDDDHVDLDGQFRRRSLALNGRTADGVAHTQLGHARQERGHDFLELGLRLRGLHDDPDAAPGQLVRQIRRTLHDRGLASRMGENTFDFRVFRLSHDDDRIPLGGEIGRTGVRRPNEGARRIDYLKALAFCLRDHRRVHAVGADHQRAPGDVLQRARHRDAVGLQR